MGRLTQGESLGRAAGRVAELLQVSEEEAEDALAEA